MAFPSYSTGTASVSAGGTTVTAGGGANWGTVNVQPGDILQIGQFQTIIDDNTSSTLTIPPWGGGAQSSVAYKIFQTSTLRIKGGEDALDVSRLIGALNTTGFFVFVGATETVPDPSYGEDGQFAYQPATGKTWAKTGGAWVLQPKLSFGIRQAYSSTTTDADPGAGTFRLNHATPASATAAYLDNVDAGGTTVSGVWDTFDDSTSTVRGIIRFEKANDPAIWVLFNVTGSVVDGTGYRKLTLSGGFGSGAFTAADEFVIGFFRTGDAGSTGAQGPAAGIRQAYSSTTADADPGAGTFRLNHATPASATAAYLDNADANGVTVSAIWDTYDDSTSTVRGRIRFEKSTDPTVWAEFNVTGSVVDGTGYRKLTLANGVGSGAFAAADVFSVTFFRTGNSSAGDLLAANNLSDVANAATAAGNLSAVQYTSQTLTNAQRAQARQNIATTILGHLWGLTLSAAGSTGTFSIVSGEATDSTFADLMLLPTTYTKTTSSWAVGTGNGALDTGTIANNTWYHVYIIKRPDTGVVDILVSTNASTPTLPTNYTLFRRIGSMKTNGSAQWLKFMQNGDLFLLDAAVSDVNTSALGTTAASFTLTAPLGIKTIALMRAYISHASAGNVAIVTSPDESDQVPSGSNFNVGATQAASGIAASSIQVLTNISSQIRARGNTSSITLGISTYGWIDTRGRLGP